MEQTHRARQLHVLTHFLKREPLFYLNFKEQAATYKAVLCPETVLHFHKHHSPIVGEAKKMTSEARHFL